MSGGCPICIGAGALGAAVGNLIDEKLVSKSDANPNYWPSMSMMLGYGAFFSSYITMTYGSIKLMGSSCCKTSVISALGVSNSLVNTLSYSYDYFSGKQNEVFALENLRFISSSGLVVASLIQGLGKRGCLTISQEEVKFLPKIIEPWGIINLSAGLIEYGYKYLSDYFQQTSLQNKCTKGTVNNEEIHSSPDHVNYIFGGGGLDNIYASKNPDNFFFSMCTTKIIDGKTAKIYNFNSKQDKIFLFCSKVTIQPEAIGIQNAANSTILQIKQGLIDTAITFEPETNLDGAIILNTKFATIEQSGLCHEINSEL